MKKIRSFTAVITCLVLLTGCSAPDYSVPSEVAESYVRALLAKDQSHTALELTGLNPELQRYCNAGLTQDWITNVPTNVTSIERLDSIKKGKGRSEKLEDYTFSLSGEGPFEGSDLITYIVRLKLVEDGGKDHTAAIALRPDHGQQPVTKGKMFDWKDVKWKVVPR